MSTISDIINYNNLETPLNKIEQILSLYDQEEQQLIIKNINERFATKVTDLRTKDMMGKVDFMSLFNRIKKGTENVE